jgi:hypothetical protein
MVDLARKPDETRQMPVIASDGMAKPSYPYGCCIRLDEECLGKLGLSGDLPAPGERVEFCATAVVTNASKQPDGSCPCVELQITAMGVPGAKEDRAGRWYGHGEPDGDEA